MEWRESLMWRLDGKNALVTGGSRGIGRQTAIDLAKAGANVAISYRSQDEAAQEVAKLVEGEGRTAVLLKGDVAEEAFVKEMGKTLADKLGGLDIVVNNAGITRDGPFAMMSKDRWDEVLSTNLTSQFLISKMAARLMIRKKWGRIINLTSLSGERGNAFQASYAASKGGVIALTKTVAVELSRYNITVNAVSPGLIDTEMVGAIPEEQRNKMIELIPLGRIGRPEEVSAMVVFLASDVASYITGQVFRVNGGMLM